MIKVKMIYGFCLLGSLLMLALAIGLGTVKQETSYGLDHVLQALAMLSTQFASWAFRQTGQAKEDEATEISEDKKETP